LAGARVPVVAVCLVARDREDLSARRAPSLGLSGVAAIRSTTWSPSISSSVICGG
jgi:hypothetical protein